jgi:glutathione S-transferase
MKIVAFVLFAALLQSATCFVLELSSIRNHIKSQRVGISRLSMQENQGQGLMGFTLDRAPEVLTASLASLARLGSGAFISGYRADIDTEFSNPTFNLPVREYSETLPSIRPEKPLELYEFEACPFCRKVREALSMLDVDAIIYPCPKDGTRFRPTAISKGGKAQFPYLVDPNTQFAGYESDAIIKYLFQTYGDGIVPLELSLGPLTLAASAAATALRPGRGQQTALTSPPPSPAAPLELWGYESSPFCRLVRERLCELELPHKSVTAARGSPKRERLVAAAGRLQLPYLVDPNTGAAMFESADIIAYLDRTYGPGASPAAAAPPAAAPPAPAAAPDAAPAAAAPSPDLSPPPAAAAAEPAAEGVETVKVDAELLD